MTVTALSCGLFVTLFLGGLPVPLPCLCEVVLEAGERLPPWTERPVVFEGTALTVDPPDNGARPRSAVFVIDRVWRGPVRDTATLSVESSANCLRFTPGSPYVVTADLVMGRAVARDCSPSFAAARARELASFTELGAPLWERGEFGANDFDTDVLPVGAPAPRGERVVYVGVVLNVREGLRRVSIADRVWTPGRDRIPQFQLPAGNYRIRAEWEDGEVLDSYLSVRCEHEREAAGRTCHAFRFFRHGRG